FVPAAPSAQPTLSTVRAPAAAAPRTFTTVRAAPPKVMITESKPFTNDSVIEAEISKMDELGDEMHEEIKRRSK
ncbi:MAG: hypothetical protein ABL955_09680, partial [Elusimicrobiota bacterium]